MNTIAEAKKFLADNKDKGVVCPCCERKYKIRRRPLYRGMVEALQAIGRFQESKPGPFHINDVISSEPGNQSLQTIARGGDIAKLAKWGFLEAQERTNKFSGLWSLTAKGKEFLSGSIKVPAHSVHEPGQEVWLDDEQTVNIFEALGTEFDRESVTG